MDPFVDVNRGTHFGIERNSQHSSLEDQTSVFLEKTLSWSVLDLLAEYLKPVEGHGKDGR